MKPLSEWIEDEMRKPETEVKSSWDEFGLGVHTGFRVGFVDAMRKVLAEIKAREEAERERVNENVNVLDGYAGKLLEEKEGG